MSMWIYTLILGLGLFGIYQWGRYMGRHEGYDLGYNDACTIRIFAHFSDGSEVEINPMPEEEEVEAEREWDEE